jgi:cathepsin L
MKSLLILAALFACSLAAFSEKEYQNTFTSWMQNNKRSYHHDEFQVRYRNFKNNMDIVDANNKQNNGMTLGLNKFADLSNAEFKKFYLGTKVTVETESVSAPTINNAFPTSLNWATKGAVTGIKNQEQCGSCWSFSTTGSVEGCHFQKTGKLVGLSEQNLMDCSTQQGNQGCDGGLMTQAMEYIMQNKGIDTEASYPYTAEDGTCSYSTANIGATITNYTNVATGSESDLQTKTSVGPTSVAIDASHTSFQLYTSGVYYEPACSSTQLDHGVLSVGWGVSGNTQYWIVKNSWGSDWGQSGYIWMSRDKNNNCGIATMATLPIC